MIIVVSIISARNSFVTANDYGWCYTNNPCINAKELNDRDDFVFGRHNAAFVSIFNEFNLPIPNEKQIYRGKDEDLFFLDRFGLVLRVGEIDVMDLINPAILQPLAHVTVNGITGAIYPGIELLYHTSKNEDEFEYHCCDNSFETSFVTSFLISSFQKPNDVINQNVGMIELANSRSIPILLDANKIDNGCLDADMAKDKKDYIQLSGNSRHETVRELMELIYGNVEHFNLFIQAYDYHELLRSQLQDALSHNDKYERKVRLNNFYKKCANFCNKEQGEVLLYKPWAMKPKYNNSHSHKIVVAMHV